MEDALYSARAEGRSALRIQMDVIGALLMRELHTRFGRENIGYLWLLLEPMLLTAAVTSMHALSGAHNNGSFDIGPFWATGYTPFIMWRGIASRSEAAIESNRTLIYHRYITIVDMLVARALLEFAAVVSAMFVILLLLAALGFGSLPQRPIWMIFGLLLLLWFSFAVGACIAAACERSHVASRLVHPAIYLSLPLSGAFFSMSWLSPAAQRILGWVPMTHIFEMIRMGQFENYPDRFVDPWYVIAWCMPLTLLGLLSIRIVRRSLHTN